MLNNGAAGSLIATTMEMAGTRIQSEMLDLVNGASGQTLAAFLFTLAICSGVLLFAIGGDYKWARYLLVGPPLFFFLTQVRVTSDHPTWRFGDDTFSDSLVQQASKGIKDYQSGARTGADVAYFFKFWNTFMSDLTQQLIKLTNVTEHDSHLTFIQKTERYMSIWNFAGIQDEELKMFARAIVRPECAEFFWLKRQLQTVGVDQLQKTRHANELTAKYQNAIKFIVREDDATPNDPVKKYLLEKGKAGYYTCQAMWNTLVELASPTAKEQLKRITHTNVGPNQEPDNIFYWFGKKILSVIARGSSMLTISGGDENDALEQAAAWLVARELFFIMNKNSPYADSYGFEGHSGMFQAGVGGWHGTGSQEMQTAENIRQFQYPERYQKKAELVNAAMALPHFQGLGLLLLAAAYPFFAMFLVLPNKAGAMLTWMGLWAWLKLWDFGFAVVMMIDNMLYALFPRGPSITPEELQDPGKAWVHIMELDPNYAAATYYNLIAMCMFAVPLVTGAIVKKGGAELINSMHSGYTSYSRRLADSAGVYARHLQARTYAAIMQSAQFQGAMIGMWKGLLKSEQAIKDAVATEADKGLVTALGKMDKFKNWGPDKLAKAALEVQHGRARNIIKANIMRGAHDEAYRVAVSEGGYYLAERAVAARFATHDLAPSIPMNQYLNQYLAAGYVDQHKLGSSLLDGAADLLGRFGQAAGGPKGK